MLASMFLPSDSSPSIIRKVILGASHPRFFFFIPFHPTQPQKNLGVTVGRYFLMAFVWEGAAIAKGIAFIESSRTSFDTWRVGNAPWVSYWVPTV